MNKEKKQEDLNITGTVEHNECAKKFEFYEWWKCSHTSRIDAVKTRGSGRLATWKDVK